MDIEVAQRQIASMERSLTRAKAQIDPNDPALLELERILRGKIEALENAKRNAEFESIFFADVE